MTTPAAGWATSSSPRGRAGTASGFPTAGYSGYNGVGWTVDASSHTTGAAAAILAHQRQRGDGREPVGVSSSTKPAHEIHVTTTPLLNPAR
jgi:hypothetical protein